MSKGRRPPRRPLRLPSSRPRHAEFEALYLEECGGWARPAKSSSSAKCSLWFIDENPDAAWAELGPYS